jgi:phage-related holin
LDDGFNHFLDHFLLKGWFRDQNILFYTPDHGFEPLRLLENLMKIGFAF